MLCLVALLSVLFGTHLTGGRNVGIGEDHFRYGETAARMRDYKTRVFRWDKAPIRLFACLSAPPFCPRFF
jgi:hypothetical protein